MTERQYTTKLLSSLKGLPVGHFTKIHGGPYQTAGISDIIGCYRGRYIAVEVKDAKHKSAPNGGLTPLQMKFLAEVRAAGGLEIIVYTSATPEAVVEHIRQYVR